MGRQIAVLGGGLTGLSSAFHLSRRFPEASITLLEKSPRLGGWVSSERVSVTHPEGHTAEVILESGPRTLRPNAKSVLELIHLLGLKDLLKTTPTTAPAAKFRYLQIPESQGLVSIPTSVLSILSSPLRSILVPYVLQEPMKRANRPAGLTDESLDSFMSRRFGDMFSRTFGSALVHGIYAADSRNLSVRAAFPSLWDAEERGWGSVVRGFLVPKKYKPSQADSDFELGDILQLMNGVSVFTFQDGISTITNGLVDHLKQKPNVKLFTNTGAERLELADGKILLTTSNNNIMKPTHVVSALPLHVLHSILSDKEALPHLTANPSSSITVINLVFPLDPRKPRLHPPGFGYLIPRPITDYAPTDAGILGTVFDSYQKYFANMTVMTGGPYPTTPDLDAVLSHLSTHLAEGETDSYSAKELPRPILVRTTHQKSCIPMPTPGHRDRMAELKNVLATGPWQGRLEVVGAGVRGVSVGDCVESGKRVGLDWK
ncbi:protoporphyrinogen oxidase [Moniliophthora roreri MCA 2997]|uniref:Protoporphyrinogen oxidase n=2 Tax=Moniliophthora roreri TaxID=221103 RepID=V2YA44_MONRO|nr:protoporphyrinogen oxidase [Moniliophthora roreri MCA 2997]